MCHRWTIALLAAAPLLGCAAARPPGDVGWKGPRTAQPGAAVRHGDQAEPRLEPLPESPARAADEDQIGRAAELSRQAAASRAAGDLDEALRLQREAVRVREEALGPDHPEVAATLTTVAAIEVARGDYAAAEPPLLRALSIREQSLGPGHRLTAQSLSNLALLYAAAARFDDAEPLYERALAILATAPAATDQVVVLENYAAMLADMGRAEESEQLETRARALRAVQTPPDPAE